MAAKRIRVSADNTTFYTLPGNSGTLTNSGSQVSDTVFGQLYESGFTSLINWTVTTNAIIKGVSGYKAEVLKAGTSTSMSEEATTISGTVATITAEAKRLIDVTSNVIVRDNGSVVNSGYKVDYLFGRILFDAVPTGAVTVTGKYRPLGTVGRAKSISLTQTARAIDETDYDSARTENGHMVYSPGLKTVGLELGGIYDVGNGFLTALRAREPLIISIDVEGNGNSIARGYFVPQEQSQSGNIGDLEAESIQFALNVPDEELLDTPFSWDFATASKVNLGVKAMIDSWLDGTPAYAQYLPDGITGLQGEVVITTISFANTIEGLNEYSLTLQGSGEPATI